MATLAPNKSHSWEKNKYTKLAFDWTDKTNPGKDKDRVSVIIGDDPVAKSYPVPQADIPVDKKSGKLTNNTSAKINYTLS